MSTRPHMGHIADCTDWPPRRDVACRQRNIMSMTDIIPERMILYLPCPWHAAYLLYHNNGSWEEVKPAGDLHTWRPLWRWGNQKISQTDNTVCYSQLRYPRLTSDNNTVCEKARKPYDGMAQCQAWKLERLSFWSASNLRKRQRRD